MFVAFRCRQEQAVDTPVPNGLLELNKCQQHVQEHKECVLGRCFVLIMLDCCTSLPMWEGLVKVGMKKMHADVQSSPAVPQ